MCSSANEVSLDVVVRWAWILARGNCDVVGRFQSAFVCLVDGNKVGKRTQSFLACIIFDSITGSLLLLIQLLAG